MLSKAFLGLCCGMALGFPAACGSRTGLPEQPLNTDGGGGRGKGPTDACVPNCVSKSCGASDGCLGICLQGSCPSESTCVDGHCASAQLCPNPKPANQALILDGSQCVTVAPAALNAALTSTGDLTVEVWSFFPTAASIPTGTSSAGPFSMMAAKPIGTSWGDSFGVYFQAGWGFDSVVGSAPLANSYDAVTAFVNPPVARWLHIALTFSRGTQIMTMVVFDPSSAQPTIATQPGDAIAYDGNPLVIGADIDTGALSSFFTGELDELYVWNVVRDATEIANDRENCTLPTASGLVGYWPFDGDFTDASHHGGDGVPSDPRIAFDPTPGVPF